MNFNVYIIIGLVPHTACFTFSITPPSHTIHSSRSVLIEMKVRMYPAKFLGVRTTLICMCSCACEAWTRWQCVCVSTYRTYADEKYDEDMQMTTKEVQRNKMKKKNRIKLRSTSFAAKRTSLKVEITIFFSCSTSRWLRFCVHIHYYDIVFFHSFAPRIRSCS